MKRIEDIANVIKSTCEQFINKPVSKELREQVKESIINIIRSMLQEELYNFNDIQLEIKQKDSNTIEIKPKNLFTYLIIQGLYVPMSFLTGKTEYAPPHGGIVYGYDEINGGYYYIPKRYYEKDDFKRPTLGLLYGA